MADQFCACGTPGDPKRVHTKDRCYISMDIQRDLQKRGEAIPADITRGERRNNAQLCGSCGADRPIDPQAMFNDCPHCGDRIIGQDTPPIEDLNNLCRSCRHPIAPEHDDFGCNIPGCPCAVSGAIAIDQIQAVLGNDKRADPAAPAEPEQKNAGRTYRFKDRNGEIVEVQAMTDQEAWAKLSEQMATTQSDIRAMGVRMLANASTGELQTAWRTMGDDMVDALGLGDMAIADPRTGQLYPLEKQPAEVQRRWKDAYEDAHENRNAHPDDKGPYDQPNKFGCNGCDDIKAPLNRFGYCKSCAAQQGPIQNAGYCDACDRVSAECVCEKSNAAPRFKVGDKVTVRGKDGVRTVTHAEVDEDGEPNYKFSGQDGWFPEAHLSPAEKKNAAGLSKFCSACLRALGGKSPDGLNGFVQDGVMHVEGNLRGAALCGVKALENAIVDIRSHHWNRMTVENRRKLLSDLGLTADANLPFSRLPPQVQSYLEDSAMDTKQYGLENANAAPDAESAVAAFVEHQSACAQCKDAGDASALCADGSQLLVMDLANEAAGGVAQAALGFQQPISTTTAKPEDEAKNVDVEPTHLDKDAKDLAEIARHAEGIEHEVSEMQKADEQVNASDHCELCGHKQGLRVVKLKGKGEKTLCKDCAAGAKQSDAIENTATDKCLDCTHTLKAHQGDESPGCDLCACPRFEGGIPNSASEMINAISTMASREAAGAARYGSGA